MHALGAKLTAPLITPSSRPPRREVSVHWGIRTRLPQALGLLPRHAIQWTTSEVMWLARAESCDSLNLTFRDRHPEFHRNGYVRQSAFATHTGLDPATSTVTGWRSPS